jgi:hypothetical protein
MLAAANDRRCHLQCQRGNCRDMKQPHTDDLSPIRACRLLCDIGIVSNQGMPGPRVLMQQCTYNRSWHVTGRIPSRPIG